MGRLGERSQVKRVVESHMAQHSVVLMREDGRGSQEIGRRKEVVKTDRRSEAVGERSLK